MKLRVLIISTLYSPNSHGGAELSVQRLAESLADVGMAVTVVCMHRERRISYAILNGVRVVYLPLTNLYWPYGKRNFATTIAKPVWHVLNLVNPRMHRLIMRVVRSERPHVVNTQMLTLFGITFLPALAALGIPVVQTLHDYHFVCANGHLVKRGKPCQSRCVSCRFLRWPKRLAGRCISAVVGVSRHILELHRKNGFFLDAECHHVRNSVLPAQPVCVSTLAEHPLRLGYLGRIEPVKGLEPLLRDVLALSPGPTLRVAGSSGDAAYLAMLKRRYDSERITFMGWSAPRDLFKQIDYLVVPSIWPEVAPLVIIEAYAHGVPVIASRIGGLPELVIEGETGHLYGPESDSDSGSGAFASAFSLLKPRLRDPKHQLKLRETCLRFSRTFHPRIATARYASLLYRHSIHALHQAREVSRFRKSV